MIGSCAFKVPQGCAFRCGLVALAALALAPPAAGRVVPQYDGAEVPGGKADALVAQQDLYDYGDCLARARRPQVERYLETEPFSRSAVRIGQQVAGNDCRMSGVSRVSAESLRGPFYQSLYRRDFGRKPMPELKNAPMLDYSFASAADGRGDAAISTNLRRFADCVVRQDSWSARALAMSDIDSDAENKAFKALAPAMGSCIAPGDKVAFQPPLLRAVFSEVLYRLAAANAGQPMPMDRK